MLKIRKQVFLLIGIMMGIDSVVVYLAVSTSDGSDPAGGNPAGSFQPAGSYEPAGQGILMSVLSFCLTYMPVHADESTFILVQSLAQCYSYTNLELVVEVNPVPTKRVNTIHPQSQIIGDLASPVLTRSRAQKSKFGEKEMQQFINQKVWKLVPLPDGKNAIGTKWILKNKRDARGIVVRNKARLVAQGHRQEEGIDYDETSMLTIHAYKVDMESVELQQQPYEAAKTKLKDVTDPHLVLVLRHKVLQLTSHHECSQKIFKKSTYWGIVNSGLKFNFIAVLEEDLMWILHKSEVEIFYILPADMLVSAGSTMILLVVILLAGCLVSAGSYGLC
ncbi:putative ribonuclease H-like domain-containing protein [Tanacetum coccineum]